MADETVNINEASAKELKGLTGVGGVIANRIIEYRESHDGFDSVAQLEEVKGIGSATLDDIGDRVTAGG
ncbi:MAG: helix-hairpin-helix domain-containing protein [Thiohalorhabdus sp.]